MVSTKSNPTKILESFFLFSEPQPWLGPTSHCLISIVATIPTTFLKNWTLITSSLASQFLLVTIIFDCRLWFTMILALSLSNTNWKQLGTSYPANSWVSSLLWTSHQQTNWMTSRLHLKCLHQPTIFSILFIEIPCFHA